MVYINAKNSALRVAYGIMKSLAYFIIMAVIVNRFFYNFMSYGDMVMFSYISAACFIVYGLLSTKESLLKAYVLEMNKGIARKVEDNSKVQCTPYYIASMYVSSFGNIAFGAFIIMFTDSSIFSTSETVVLGSLLVGFFIYLTDSYLVNKYCQINPDTNKRERVIWRAL